MAFDYFLLFKKSRVVDTLKESGFTFSALEKVFLIYNSNKTYREKLSVYEEIIRDDGHVVLTEANVSGSRDIYDFTLGSMLCRYIEDREKLLLKFRNSESDAFYRISFNDDMHYYDTPAQVPGYYKSVIECKEAYEKYLELITSSIGRIRTITIDKCYYETKYSPYDDSVIYCTYNKDFELLSVAEVATGFVDYPDPDVELLQQLDFKFLTPLRTRYGEPGDYF